jgi:hypothetical protein
MTIFLILMLENRSDSKNCAMITNLSIYNLGVKNFFRAFDPCELEQVRMDSRPHWLNSVSKDIIEISVCRTSWLVYAPLRCSVIQNSQKKWVDVYFENQARES